MSSQKSYKNKMKLCVTKISEKVSLRRLTVDMYIYLLTFICMYQSRHIILM